MELLEEQRLQFVRMQGAMVYMRGTGPDGALLTMTAPDGKIANSAELPQAIKLGLQVAQGKLRDFGKLQSLLEKQSINEDTRFVVGAIADATYQDFRQSRHWRKFYSDPDPKKLQLLSIAKTSGKVLGSMARKDNPVDILLSLAQNNVELHLAQKYECCSTSTSSPLGESIGLKIDRLTKNQVNQKDLWRLFEVNDVPDVSPALLGDKDSFRKFIRLTKKSNAQDFRKWFHSVTANNEADVIREYVSILKSVPTVGKTPMKSLRFAITTALGVVPILGTVAGFLDTFIIEKILKGKSPRYFIEDFSAFQGKLKK